MCKQCETDVSRFVLTIDDEHLDGKYGPWDFQDGWEVLQERMVKEALERGLDVPPVLGVMWEGGWGAGQVHLLGYWSEEDRRADAEAGPGYWEDSEKRRREHGWPSNWLPFPETPMMAYHELMSEYDRVQRKEGEEPMRNRFLETVGMIFDQFNPKALRLLVGMPYGLLWLTVLALVGGTVEESVAMFMERPYHPLSWIFTGGLVSLTVLLPVRLYVWLVARLEAHLTARRAELNG